MIDSKSILQRLGQGDRIASICEELSMSRGDFDSWWHAELNAARPHESDVSLVGLDGHIDIIRDSLGIPRIQASNNADLFFGFGYAVAQDRLFQLDYLRRKGLGRLAEVLGKEAVESDRIARTVGLNRIADAEWSTIENDKALTDTRVALTRFAEGVNQWISDCEQLPIEFALLDYSPDTWQETDSLAIEIEFRWYLTGRFPILFMPEVAKRSLSPEMLEDYLTGEAEDEAILHRGDYASTTTAAAEPVGKVLSHPDSSIGSNNWVIAGGRTTTGQPMLASDPHIAIESVSCWYQVHLSGGDYEVAGMAYTGMPAVMFGRNRNVAWGITNNICSQRDLYRERTSDEHPGCFEYDGQWEQGQTLSEAISIRDQEEEELTVSCSRNGPVVNALLPDWATQGETVTLKWLGAYQGGWLTSLLDMDRASDGTEFCDALRPWHVPTFSLVVADQNNDIFYQVGGRIPLRQRGERGFRNGWDPADQWNGLLPFEDMPRVKNPERGWIATANNRLAADDFPYLMHGCWSSGYRAQRIREMIEEREKISREDMQIMQTDVYSLRAAATIPSLLAALGEQTGLASQASDALAAWDRNVTRESVAATIFNVFYSFWSRTVAEQQFPQETLDWMSRGVEPVAGRLLAADPNQWFPNEQARITSIGETFQATVDYLADRFGEDVDGWQWSQLHRLRLPHFLSQRGDLGELLSQNGPGVAGDMGTVANTGSGEDWYAATGAGYRMIADLSEPVPTLHAIDAPSQSGNPGSSHFNDQLPTWLAGQYTKIELRK